VWTMKTICLNPPAIVQKHSEEEDKRNLWQELDLGNEFRERQEFRSRYLNPGGTRNQKNKKERERFHENENFR